MQKNPLPKPFYKLLCFFSTSFVLILVDQFLKYKIRLGGGFYLCNKGISFGFFIPNIVFWLALGMFLVLGIFFLYKHRPFTHFFVIGLSLFISGALSNIIDRIILGCVLDYIFIFKKTMPIFNIADVQIIAGACFLFLEVIIKSPLKSE